VRRVYKTARAAVYCGDCRDAPALWPKGIADLIVTDPPYGISYQSNRRREKFDKIDGDEQLDMGWATTLAPILRRKRHIYIFGPRLLELPDPFTKTAELIWNKDSLALGDLTSPWSNSHETITFSTMVPSRAERSDGQGRLAARMRQGSVLTHKRPEARMHPNRKPVDLIRQLIESSSLYGEIVFDPFAGSGSTGEAALLEGRRAILIELDMDYCQLVAERLRRLEAWLDKEPN
jgi:DNA modification methylase